MDLELREEIMLKTSAKNSKLKDVFQDKEVKHAFHQKSGFFFYVNSREITNFQNERIFCYTQGFLS